MKKLIVGLLPVMALTFTIVSAGIITVEDVKQTSSCISSQSDDRYYYIAHDNYKVFPDDTFGNNVDSLISRGPDTSVQIRRNGILSNCNDWGRISNVVSASDSDGALVIANDDGCILNKPNYTKINNPTAIDAQIHYTIGYRKIFDGGKTTLESKLYHRNQGVNVWTCYPGGKPEADSKNCPTVSVKYGDQNYHKGECLNYRVFRCGDGLINRPDGTNNYNNGSYNEECDPKHSDWEDRKDGQSCNPNTCKIEYEVPVCSSNYNNKKVYTNDSTPYLKGLDSENLCNLGKLTQNTFKQIGTPIQYTWGCTNGTQSTSSNECKFKQYRCGDGEVNGGGDWSSFINGAHYEQCDPTASEWKNRTDGQVCNNDCTYGDAICGPASSTTPVYNPNYPTSRIKESELCKTGKLKEGSFSGPDANGNYTWICINGTKESNPSCGAKDLRCGDGKKNGNEQCDYRDTENKEGWGGKWERCNDRCERESISQNGPVCNPSISGHTEYTTYSTDWLNRNSGLCSVGEVTDFKSDWSLGNQRKFTWRCSNDDLDIVCTAKQERCGDGIKNGSEVCDYKDTEHKNGRGDGCSTTCDKATYETAECGSDFNEKVKTSRNTRYQDISKPWINENTDGLCKKGSVEHFTVHTGLNNGGYTYTWQCNNNGNYSDTCGAYQEWCGDGKKNGNEQCDYKDENEINRGNDGCSMSCEKKIQPDNGECNDTFYYTLRHGWKYTFYDKFIPGGTRYLYDFDIKFDEKKPYDFNQGENPTFSWMDDLGDGVYKVVSTTRRVIKSQPQYEVKTHPNFGDSSDDDIYIEYTIKYSDKAYSSKPDDSKLKTHKECVYYKISRCGDGVLDTEYNEECDPEAEPWKSDHSCDPETCTVKPQGKLKTTKEVVTPKDKIIKNTGDQVSWKITVEAVGGNVEMKWITDTLPNELEYSGSRVKYIPSGITIEDPKISGNDIRWKVEGTLKSGDKIELLLDTKAIKMPAPQQTVKNVACAISQEDDKDCGTGQTTSLRIKKYILDGNKEVKNKNVKIGEEITYKVYFGNNGDTEATVTSIKDFLPKNVKYKSSEIHINRNASHASGTQKGDEEFKGYKIVDGVYIDIYGGITLQPGDNGYIIIKAEVLNDNQDYRTNFACIYLNNEVVDCDDASHDIAMMCEKLTIPAGDIPNTGGSKEVKCTTTSGQIAKIIEIDCGSGASGSRYITGSNIASLTGTCTYPAGANRYNLQCKVDGQTRDNCKGSVIVKDKDKYLCEKLTFPAGELPNSGGSKKVECSSISGYTAKIIEIDCGSGASGSRYITGSNIASLTGTCTYPAGANRYNLQCKVDGQTRDNCKGSVIVKDKDKNMCEKLDIPVGNLSNAGGSKSVTCTTTSGYTAKIIEIDCGSGASGSRYITGSNIASLTGTCTYLGNGTSSSKSYSVQCKVDGQTKDSCKGTVIVEGYSCFPAGTKVTMADGSMKNIEDVKVGDTVLSYNTDTNTNERSVVKQTFVHEDSIHEMYELTINGNVLKVTDIHPFYVRKSDSSKDYAWVEAQDLKVGDVLLMSDGKLVKIDKINHYNNQETVYNLEVEGNHDYFVDKGYLVHNKPSSCFIAGTKVTMADGSQKNIEDVRIGEKVLGSNGTVNTVLGYDRPVLGSRHLWSINGSEYFVSDEHPFMTTQGWKSFNPEMTKLEVDLDTTELKVGDILITNSGLEEIKSVDYISADYDTPLYNFMLDGDHTYYANDYLVHNKCIGDCCNGCFDREEPKLPYCEENPKDPMCELANPRCFNVNEGNFSIELGEYLPFYFNVFRDTSAPEKERRKYVFAKPDYEYELGTVDLGSLKCKYRILDPNNNIVYSGDDIKCLQPGDARISKNSLIGKWKAKQKDMYDIDVDSMGGKYWPTISRTKSSDWKINSVLGEYKFQIIVYEYKQYNDDGKWETHTMTDPICQSNFVLTDSYTVQKTPSGNLTASTKTLEKFKDVEGSEIIPFSRYLNAISTSEYHPNKKVNDAMDDFIKKYEKLAVSVEKGDKKMKKVPGKNIYFISGDYTVNGGDFSTAFTFVQTNPNATITINGNSNLNMMILTKGHIAFKGDCTSNQNVKGIFYASGNLVRTGVLHNDNLANSEWCTKGGLNIKGVLIGNGFNNLMTKSRSHLESWFGTTDKKGEIMKGGSVVIEYSPSIFTKSTMPPGAEDFTTALSIYKN